MELFSEMGASADTLLPSAIEHGLSVIGAIIILILGYIVAG